VAIKVSIVAHISGGKFAFEDVPTRRKGKPWGDVVEAMMHMDLDDDPVPLDWSAIGHEPGHFASEGWSPNPLKGERVITMTMQIAITPFIGRRDYFRSLEEPVPFRGEIGRRRVWLFKDRIFLAAREPGQAEEEEVKLRVRAIYFEHDDEMRRLREAVANYEGVQELAKSGPKREQIPDDVKLLVWTRDGGACVRCGATSNLHFDHEIPLAKGGGNHAENIRLLCETCNLKKGDRLA
jgi:hypothetical protein